MNPLLDEKILKDEIDFQEIKGKHFITAFEKLIPLVTKEFEEELLLPLTYENLFEKSKKSEHLSKIISYLNHLNGVVQSDELRDIYGKYIPQISAMYQEMSLDKRSYDKIVKFRESEEFKSLNNLRQKMINDIILNLELGGINLAEDKKKRLQEISFALTELSDKFENNLMDVQNSFEREIDLKELTGLPQRSLNNLEHLENGKVLISDSSGIYDDILTFCDNEKTRKLIYEEKLALGIKEGNDNRPLIDEILKLKREESNILGYKNFAEVSLIHQMIKKPEQVLSFIEDLANKSLKQAQKETQEVNEFGEKLLGRKLEFYDRGYVVQKMKEQLYSVNQEEIRKYFPVNKVLNGLFKIVETLFSISFENNQEKSKWHDDVNVFTIYNKNKEKIGLLYLDLYKRKNKESGAWMLSQSSKVDTEFDKKEPINYLVLNIPKSQKGESTIEFDDIVTLFHEMGHGLHNILSDVKEEYFSGLSNVEHDAIELPSQFMENFVWDYEVLKELSEHIEDKSILPLELFEKMQKGKFFLSANQMIRQSIFAYLDMYIHTYNVNAKEAEKEIFNKWKTRAIDERSEFLPTFSHIFSGGYAAGYYSYKWSEVLSSDAFHALKESGDTYIEQKEMANQFREKILSRGGTKDMLENFIEFRGREPDVKYLLKDNGIFLNENILKNKI